jgi:hypothetical protein
MSALLQWATGDDERSMGSAIDQALAVLGATS